MTVYGAGLVQGRPGGRRPSAMSRPYFDPLQMPWSGHRVAPPSRRGRGPRQPGQAAAVRGRQAPAAGLRLPAARPRRRHPQAPAPGQREDHRPGPGRDRRRTTADLENVVCPHPGHRPGRRRDHPLRPSLRGPAEAGRQRQHLRQRRHPRSRPRPQHARSRDGPPAPAEADHPLHLGPGVLRHRRVGQGQPGDHGPDALQHQHGHGRRVADARTSRFFCLMRTTYGNPHYINDVMENYYRYVGEGNRERIQNRSSAAAVPVAHRRPDRAPTSPSTIRIETHYGASDHEVFNDWGVGRPGHHDDRLARPVVPHLRRHGRQVRPDPAQAGRRDRRRGRVHGRRRGRRRGRHQDRRARSAANATRRLGHHARRRHGGPERRHGRIVRRGRTATPRGSSRPPIMNEKETLGTVLELAPGDAALAADVGRLAKAVDGAGAADLAALDAHRPAVAGKLGVKPAAVRPHGAREEAAQIVPRPTAKVRARTATATTRSSSRPCPAAERAKFPLRRRRTWSWPARPEMQLLVNGKHSALDIKKMLDAQHERRSTLQAVLNYLEILKTGRASWSGEGRLGPCGI
ncbi:MAG: hypothetical protein MZW92_62195 [Comamonadaceae bacterium]|nr:hypothetical protein [Comamonadaceae bacterium]